MRERTKRKILGNGLYSVYRKIRFLLYKRKKLKERRKFLKSEKIQEQEEFRKRVKEKALQDKALEKEKSKQLKTDKKIEHNEIRTRIKKKAIKDRIVKKEEKKLLKLKKKEKKYNRRRLIRYIIKKQRRKLIYEIKTFDLNTLKRLFKGFKAIAENKDQRNNFLVISANSFVLFLLSYLLIYIIGQFITVLVSLSFDYKTILFYYKIYYNIDPGEWMADSVKILYSIQPVIALILGTISIIIYSTFRNETGLLKLFFLWAFVHGMVMFFGSLLMGTLLNKGFGWVIAYLYYRDTGKMVFSIISIFALVTVGGVISKSFLISGNSYFNFINKQNRMFLLSSQVLIPAILGTIVLIILKIPSDFYYSTIEEALFKSLKLCTIILVIIPIIASFISFNEIYFDEEPRKIKLAWKFALFTIIALIAFRYGLYGINFGE
ncbi:MAG: hypothetical protein K8R37_07955 [Bacteroidales bacterium]|nr:hypothetical protein [Bacteroidales bacterium]